MTQFNTEELAHEIAQVLEEKLNNHPFEDQAYTEGYNKAIEDAVSYMKSYARNMVEPMCEYTHTQNEAQKYILNRVSKALNKLKKG